MNEKWNVQKKECEGGVRGRKKGKEEEGGV